MSGVVIYFLVSLFFSFMARFILNKFILDSNVIISSLVISVFNVGKYVSINYYKDNFKNKDLKRYEGIGDLIKYKRLKCNMSQQDLADRLYLTRKIISRWESGGSVPSIEYIHILSDVLDIPINEIINRVCYKS